VDPSKKQLTSDDEFVGITQMAIEQMGYYSRLDYWNDYNPKRKPRGLIAVLGVHTEPLGKDHKPSHSDIVTRLEIRPEPPHWVTFAVISDDGFDSFRQEDEIDVHDPDSFNQLAKAILKRARIKLGKPDWAPNV
jgi:hypothetical protein